MHPAALTIWNQICGMLYKNRTAPFLIWPIWIGNFKKGAFIFGCFLSRIFEDDRFSDIRLFYFQKGHQHLKSWKSLRRDELTWIVNQKGVAADISRIKKEIRKGHRKHAAAIPPSEAPVCTRSKLCVGCQFPASGFICWGEDGDCMKTRMASWSVLTNEGLFYARLWREGSSNCVMWSEEDSGEITWEEEDENCICPECRVQRSQQDQLEKVKWLEEMSSGLLPRDWAILPEQELCWFIWRTIGRSLLVPAAQSNM